MMIFIATFVFNLLLIAGFLALLRRNAARSDTGRSSRRLLAFMISLWFGIAVASLLLAISTTTSARAEIAMRVLSTKQPFAAISRADPRMWERLRTAVEEGLDRPDGQGMTASIEKSVGSVLRPYMTDKLEHAPDASVVQMGRLTLASMKRASRTSPSECTALSRGDETALRKYVDEDATGAWLESLIRSEPAPQPVLVDRTVFATRLAAAMAEKGMVMDVQGGEDAACRNAIMGMETVLSMPEAEAASGLRSLGQGVRMVTR